MGCTGQHRAHAAPGRFLHPPLGDGELTPLVFLHGIAQDARAFAPQIAEFGADRRVHALELPGHGALADAPGPFGHEEMADHLLSELAAIPGPILFWGTHTGATVGLLAAIREPGRFVGLVLEGPLLAGRNPPAVTALQATVVDIIERDGLDAGLDAWWREGPWFAELRADPVARRAEGQREMLAGFTARPWLDKTPPRPVRDVAAQLPSLDLPVLICNGERDHPDFLAAAETIAGALPQAERALIPDAGGFPAWEKPDAVNSGVRAFLAR